MKNTPIIFFYILLISISIGFLYIISPFLIAIFLAFITAYFFKKPYEYFLEKFRKRIAVLLTLLLITASVILPIISIFSLISFEAQKNYSSVQKLLIKSFNQTDQELENFPIIAMLKDNEIANNIKTSLKENILGYIKDISNFVFSLFKKLFIDLTTIILNFLIMLYLLFFLLQEGNLFTTYSKSFIPFKEEEKDEFIYEAVRVIDATIIGTIFIGIIEGIWGGIIFSLLNIPSPATWGLIMFILSMLPVLGTNGILGPVAIYQLISGKYILGILILVIGCGGIVINQNIIKTKLVGDRSGVHPAILILSSLGGISLLGIIGFIVGPAIATLFIVFWKQFRNKISILKDL